MAKEKKNIKVHDLKPSKDAKGGGRHRVQGFGAQSFGAQSVGVQGHKGQGHKGQGRHHHQER